MKHIIYLTSILLSLFFVSCEKDAELPRRNNENTEIANEQKDDSDNIVKGIVRVKLSAEIVAKFSATKSDVITKSGNDALDAYMQEIGAKSMTRTFPHNEEYENLEKQYGLNLWYDIEFDKSKPITKVTSTFEHMNGIIAVANICKINRPKLELTGIPIPCGSVFSKAPSGNGKWDDPLFYKQWHFYNDCSWAPTSRKGADINLVKAWDLSYGDPKVIVAVLDGGLDYNHVDLKANLWNDGMGCCGGNFTEPTSNIRKINPDNHGTHVAGIIGAVNNNGEGVCGIAGGNSPGTGVKIMGCQIFRADGQGDSRAIPLAFKFAAEKGAVIANNSWDCKYSLPDDIKDAIDYFIGVAGCDPTGKQREGSKMKGGVVIFASGNYYDEANPYAKLYPAAYDSVIAVCGMQPDFVKTTTANCGEWVDFIAPGGQAVHSSTSTARRDVFSTIVNGYSTLGGTSHACPHVSGVAALIVSKLGGPGFTNKDLKERLLMAGSKEVYKYNKQHEGKLGVGLIDAFAALSQDEGKAPEAVTKVTTKPSAKSIVLEWVAVKDGDDITASKYNIYRSTSKITTDNPGTLTVVDAGRVNVGETIKTEIVGLQPETTYYFTIQAEDRWGHTSGVLSFEATTTKEVNIAPVLTVEGGNDIKVEQGKTASVTIKVTDKLGWSCTVDGAPAGITHTKNTDNIKLDITKEAPVGKHAIKVTVTNTANLSASETINVEVTAQGGTTPEDKTLSIVKPIDAVSLEVNGNKSINLGDFFNDSKGNTITYTVTSDNKSVAYATVNGATLNVKAVGEGSCNITVTANNGKNETLSSSFKVTVSKNGGSTPDNEVLAKLTSASPVSDVLSVKINSRVNSCNLVIAGTTGKVVLNKDLSFGSDAERNLNINVAKLAAGAYVLKVSSNGETFTQHFVKL